MSTYRVIIADHADEGLLGMYVASPHPGAGTVRAGGLEFDTYDAAAACRDAWTDARPTISYVIVSCPPGDSWGDVQRTFRGDTPYRRGSGYVRTWRVIIADSFDPDEVGTYVVTDNPRRPAIAGSPAWETTSRDEAGAAAERFTEFFGNGLDTLRYEAVSRFGQTWDELSTQTRQDNGIDNPTMCAAFMCAAPVHRDGYCEGHAESRAPSEPGCQCRICRPSTPTCAETGCGDTATCGSYCDRHVPQSVQRRRRGECEECGTRNVHHDDLAERFVCDHVARELLDAGKPVTTDYSLAPA